MSAKIIFTPEMDAALREMRAKGKGQEPCAKRIGVAVVVINKRLVELGMPTNARRWRLQA